MLNMIVFLGLITSAVPINYRHRNNRNSEADRPNLLNKEKNKFKFYTKNKTRFRRILRLPPPSKIKTRPPSFHADTHFYRIKHYTICNTNGQGNSKMSRNGNTYSGSKSFTFSEKGNRLICRTQAYRLVKKNGTIKRIAVDSSAVLSNDRNPLNMLKYHYKINPNLVDVASVGHSSITDLAARNDAVSAINTETKDSRASILSKSKKTPGFLETASSAEGKTILNNKAKGMKTWGKEETKLLTKPQHSVRSSSGRTSRHILTRLSHKKQSDFEIEI